MGEQAGNDSGAGQNVGYETSGLTSGLFPVDNEAPGAGGRHLIIIHGITDLEWNVHRRWEIWRSWLNKMGLGSEHQIWRYQYDIETEASRLFTMSGVEEEAHLLLDCLRKRMVRREPPDTEDDGADYRGRVVFVALDIGGLIVKKALTIASMNPAKYGYPDYMTSTLIFVNFPHRASRTEQLEDRVVEFLSHNAYFPPNSVRKIKNIAQSVQEINASFLETKLLYTAIIFNIVSEDIRNRSWDKRTETRKKKDEDEDGDDTDDQEESPRDKKPPVTEKSHPPRSRDRPLSHFGVAFECTYKSPLSHSELILGPVDPDAEMLSDAAFSEMNTVFQEIQNSEMDQEKHRAVVSQAPPLFLPDPGKGEALSNDRAERILEAEPYNKWLNQKGASVLHLHGTSHVSEVSRRLYERLNSGDSGNDDQKGLSRGGTFYFEFCRRDVRFNNIKAMLTAFISSIIGRTGHINGIVCSSVLERLYAYRCWSLEDLYKAFTAINNAHITSLRYTFIISRLDQCDETKLWFLNKIAEMSSRSRYRLALIITTQGSEEFDQNIAQGTAIDLDEYLLEEYKNINLTETGSPQGIFASSGASETNPGRALVSCLRVAVRPLTIEELGFLLASHGDHGGKKAGMDNNQLKTLLQYLPDALVATPSSQSGEIRLKDLVSACASIDAVDSSKDHANIARHCLQYLSSPAVQQEMKELCDMYTDAASSPMAISRHNLIAYATMHWPTHYRLAGTDKPLKEALEFLCTMKTRIIWSAVHYALSNPVSRRDRSFLHLLPVIAMIGLDDLMAEVLHQEKDSKDFQSDCGLALSEAARSGHVSTVHLLLNTVELPMASLSDAINAATSLEDGGIILQELVARASKIDNFKWPPQLIVHVARLGLTDTTKVLLDSGADIDPPDTFQGRSPLHIACLYGHVGTVKVLLAANADVHSRAIFRRTPLHAAALGGCPDITTLLIGAGSEIEAQDIWEEGPLESAAGSGSVEAIEVLLAAGANPNCGGNRGSDSPWEAKLLVRIVLYHDTEAVRALLKCENLDLNCQWKGCTPLYTSVTLGEREIAEMLLDAGADPNVNPAGYSLILLVAVDLKRLDMVKLLLDHGVKIEEEDKSTTWRNTALSLAAGLSDSRLVSYLLERGADANHCGKNSQPPIYAAAWSGQTENMRILLDAKADPNVVMESNNWRPITAAYDNPEILQMLLDKGVDVDTPSDDGTCLKLAVENNETASVQTLLKHRPKPNIETLHPSPNRADGDRDYTPLNIACYNGHTKIIRLLAEAGADTNHRTHLGKRPLDNCIRSDSVEGVRTLLEYRVPVDYTDDEGNTVLHRIGFLTPRSTVQLLIDLGVSIHTVNKRGFTPLCVAVESRNPAVVTLLVSRGARPNQFGDAYISLFHIACAERHLPTVKALVKAGANLKRADSIENGPGLLTTALGTLFPLDLSLLEYLIDTGGADPNRRGGPVDNPLMAACSFRHTEHFRFLLGKGANPDIEDPVGRRPLHPASAGGADGLDLLEALLSYGAATVVNERALRDKLGRTPVHFAAAGADLDVLKRVAGLYKEEELTSPDDDGWTPLFWALLNRDATVELIEYLIRRPEDIWAKAGVRGQRAEWSPLKLGRFTGVSEEVLKLLVPDKRVRLVGPKGKEERWDDHFHKSPRGSYMEGICDGCYIHVYGTVYYTCSTCVDYWLCFKCYEWRDVIHPCRSEDDWSEFWNRPGSPDNDAVNLRPESDSPTLTADQEDDDDDDDDEEDDEDDEDENDDSDEDDASSDEVSSSE